MKRNFSWTNHFEKSNTEYFPLQIPVEYNAFLSSIISVCGEVNLNVLGECVHKSLLLLPAVDFKIKGYGYFASDNSVIQTGFLIKW